MSNATPRLVIDIERREKVTILKLECGHHRSIGGHTFMSEWCVGPAHLMKGLQYPCRDGHCLKMGAAA